jgi:hypothetical protein
MIFAVISDTHLPERVEASYRHLQALINAHPEIARIVINGDLLGIFSAGKGYHSKEQLNAWLEAASPGFFSKYKGQTTEELTRLFLTERFAWLISILKKFNALRPVIFNLGNHESEKHFLLFQELKFLTGNNELPRIDQDTLMNIYNQFEGELARLESDTPFRYIRRKHLVIDDTLILGIPGVHHATDANDELCAEQEKVTSKLCALASHDLHRVSKLIIFNHTQGSFDSETGKFNTASKTLKNFMGKLPQNITQKVYVQSHNHFSYTHFQKHGDFVYVLNNAGIHGGAFNLLCVDSFGVGVYDAYPEMELIRLARNEDFSKAKGELELAGRSYPDPNVICKRESNQELPTPISLDELKARIRGNYSA